MRKIPGLIAAMMLVIVPLAACAPAQVTPLMVQTEDDAIVAQTVVEQDGAPNLLLLISDEPNDIGDFSELWVTITGLGLVLGDEEGQVDVNLDPATSVNLVELTGENAVALWEGYVPEGDYTKVFLYVSDVTGTLVDGEEGETVEIKLPSNKLQVKLPLQIADAPEGEEGTLSAFVFDITVTQAGNSGKYILKPQLTESGEGKAYRLLEHTEKRVKKGQQEWAEKPEDAGQPEKAGKPETAGTGEQGGPPDEAGKPADAGKPEDAGKRESAKPE